jgi:hypothetical protein
MRQYEIASIHPQSAVVERSEGSYLPNMDRSKKRRYDTGIFRPFSLGGCVGVVARHEKLQGSMKTYEYGTRPGTIEAALLYRSGERPALSPSR